MAISMQYAMVSYMLAIAASIIALALGAYIYMIAANKCIKGNLLSIGHRANRIGRSNPCTDQSDLMEQFIEFIQFQSAVKQLSIVEDS